MVAETDGAAAVLGAVVAQAPNGTYSRSDLATAADVPLKTLFLADTLDELARAGLLVRVDDRDRDSEARYRIDAESPLYEAAVAFDEAAGIPSEVPS